MRHVRKPTLETLWIVRHGQSAGNVARDLAESGGHAMIDIATRDMDVPLSDLGERQSRSLGSWFGKLPENERPDAIYFSPYLRARQSAELIAAEADWSNRKISWHCDERLREKEFGILDRLTVRGIHERHPGLSEQRAHVGKFYFRPPGGESWCDVILRLRSLLDMLVRDHENERVLVVAHQVIVNCFRYLIEGLDEAAILQIDKRGDVPNCGVTEYERQGDESGSASMRLSLDNFAAPLEVAGTPITREPDAPVAAKP
jgi:broad specificity phosphatase PhoE